MTEGANTILNTVVTADMLGGILDEVVALLPIVFPVVIGFAAVRKGIGFVIGMVKGC